MKIAIITGASSGLGREMAKRIGKYYPDVEEIWLIARRRERLEKLRDVLPGVVCRVMPLDITKEEDQEQYAATLQKEWPEVRLLVNNAGYGVLGDFATADLQRQLGMVDLNIRALTAMTHLTLKFMGRGSRMINISSIASFVPNARMAVYSATKYYVRAFSRSLGLELKNRGITVTAVCPGPMTTEFEAVAGIHHNSKVFEWLPRVPASKVADGALRHAAQGRPVYTPGAFYKFYRVISAFLPDTLLMRTAKA